MKLATYFEQGPRVGIISGELLWNLRELVAAFVFETERTPEYRKVADALVPEDMAMFIRLNHRRLDVFREALAFGQQQSDYFIEQGVARPVNDARLMPPVLRPSKIVCCGSSYGRYLKELGMPEEDWPKDVKISFLKPPTALIGHGEVLTFPPDSTQWDYENELAIVIGKTSSAVALEDADEHIFGYSILNDACVRDIPKWTGGLDSPRGKAGDTWAPFGPCIVSKEDLGNDPNDLHVKTTVDGDVRQDDRTSGLLWPVQRIMAFVSRYITLLPGDIIATGSTTGNALVTNKYLKEGQTIRCEIEGIGILENRIKKRSWASELPPLSSG